MQHAPRTGRYRYLIFFSVFILALINYIDRGAIAFASTAITGEFGFDKAAWGSILGFFGYGYMFGALFGGMAVDRIGARRLWLVAGIAWSAFEILTAFAGEIGLAIMGGSALAGFAVIRIAFGFTEGPAYSVINKTISRWSPGQERGWALSLALLSSPLGAMLTAPVAVGLLSWTGSWRTAFIVLGVTSLVALLAIMRYFTSGPEENPRVSAGELAYIQGDARTAAPPSRPAAAAGAWRRFFSNPTLVCNALGYFAYDYVIFLLLTWTPKYLHDQFNFDLGSLWYVGMIPWVGACVAILVGGRLSDWLLRRTGSFFVGRSCLAAASLLLTAVFFWMMTRVSSSAAVIALMALANTFSTLPNSIYWAVIIDSVPADQVGAFSGITHCIANTGAIIAPTLAGYLASAYGYPAIFTGAAVVAFLAMIAMLAVRPGGQTPRPGPAYWPDIAGGNPPRAGSRNG
ncbi:MFS transporter [Bordetella bronchialis]|uniref:MFS transporter n=1 Tax=Bordetella bronchialis TaxID=463025 RepID=A0ABM6CVK3_9BORD|nr:MFS transporter [Bordetella bronchialis]ANN68118.1 MFS transporter [Bordetella bronchialis]